MDTFAPSLACRGTILRLLSTGGTCFVDLTDRLAHFITEAEIQVGMLTIHTRHTTTAIVVNEHEPLLLADMTLLLDRIAPQRLTYLHDDVTLRTVNCMPGERPNGHSHCRALLLGQSVCLNVAGGRLQLGRWQRLFLVELDGPRSREVSVLLAGDGAR